MEKEALIFPNTTGLFINMYLSFDCGDGNGQKAPHTLSNGLIGFNSEEYIILFGWGLVMTRCTFYPNECTNNSNLVSVA